MSLIVGRRPKSHDQRRQTKVKCRYVDIEIKKIQFQFDTVNKGIKYENKRDYKV